MVGAYFHPLTAPTGAVYVFEKPPDGWVNNTETQKLSAGDGEAGDFFGFSVSLEGDSAVFGARLDNNENGDAAGAAYVFQRAGGSWIEKAKLTTSDGVAGDALGEAVAMGQHFEVVGTVQDDSGTGSAYLFEEPAGGWTDTTETEKFTASDGATGDHFGQSVSVDEPHVLVGAPNKDGDSGAGYAYWWPGPIPPSTPPAGQDVAKNRYVSFDPVVPEATAFRLTITDMDYFPGCVGQQYWVGEPTEAAEDPGVWIARLTGTGFYSDSWPASVHVGDVGILPVATYEVEATVDGVHFSPPLELATIAQPAPKYWGDVVGMLEGDGWTGPNGVVNMDDVVGAVQKFKKLETAPHLTWVDVDAEEPNAVLNMTDIFRIVQGFKGEPYPFSAPAPL